MLKLSYIGVFAICMALALTPGLARACTAGETKYDTSVKTLAYCDTSGSSWHSVTPWVTGTIPTTTGKGIGVSIGDTASEHLYLPYGSLSGYSGVTLPYTAGSVLEADGQILFIEDDAAAIMADFNVNSSRFVWNGTAYKPGGGNWTATSDARLKDIDGPYVSGLDEIVRLSPVRFHYKKDNARGEPSDKQYVGLIAQEAMKVMPELVSMREDGYYDLNPGPLDFAFINAVQSLDAQSTALEKRLEALEQGGTQ